MSDESHDPFDFDPEKSPPPAEPPDAGRQPAEPSAGVAWGAILLLVGIALLVIFAVQNTDSVPVRFLWTEGRFSLAIVILVTAGVVILFTELFSISYRRKRRRRRVEREELKKFRSDS